MDWFSRFVLSWSLSLTMEVDFCLEALGSLIAVENLQRAPAPGAIQFTSEKFTGVLARRGAAITMDGRRRCLDNIFIERLWRSLKYEEVHLRDYTRAPEAHRHRELAPLLHSSAFPSELDYRTPACFPGQV